MNPRRLSPFLSAQIAARPVDIWLPPAYETAPATRFPVLYMHDGQNLFDPALSNTGIPWGVDSAVTRLAAGGAIRPAIVVGIWNTAQRWAEYMPQRALQMYTEATTALQFESDLGAPQADAYMRFLVEELKPWVDENYRTSTGRSDTLIMGSSMGGLISLYALCEYPATFGAAGCLSTHWPAADGAVIDYLRDHLPDPDAGHRFYFDFGTAGLDETYAPYQQRADALLTAAGYVQDRNWVTRRFPGAGHNEAAWRDRLDVPLRFLLRT
jgi:predicted alpha/beta superfamily hydrolase